MHVPWLCMQTSTCFHDLFSSTWDEHYFGALEWISSYEWQWASSSWVMCFTQTLYDKCIVSGEPRSGSVLIDIFDLTVGPNTAFDRHYSNGTRPDCGVVACTYPWLQERYQRYCYFANTRRVTQAGQRHSKTPVYFFMNYKDASRLCGQINMVFGIWTGFSASWVRGLEVNAKTS